MNLSAKEIEILNSLQREYPKPSSVKKLALSTGRDRSVIKNTLHGLKTLTMLSVTDKNEVYLLKSGKEYLGVDYSDMDPFVREDRTKVTVLKSKATESSVTPIEKEAITAPATTNIEQAFVELEDQLKKRDIRIDELSLKIEVLERLAGLLSDDISLVLANIVQDLMKADAA